MISKFYFQRMYRDMRWQAIQTYSNVEMVIVRKTYGWVHSDVTSNELTAHEAVC
jgi:hypothetical protein